MIPRSHSIKELPGATVHVVGQTANIAHKIAALGHTHSLQVVLHDSPRELLARKLETCPSCVITEFAMPVLSALDLLDALHIQRGCVQCVVLTSQLNVSQALECIRRGAVDVLQHPLQEIELLRTIASAYQLAQESYCLAQERQTLSAQWNNLDQFERQILREIMGEATNKEIAKTLRMGLRTVEEKRHNLFRKLGVTSLVGLVRFWIELEQYSLAGTPHLGVTEHPQVFRKHEASRLCG